LTRMTRSSNGVRRKPQRRRRIGFLVALTAAGSAALVAGGPAEAATPVPLVPPTITSAFTPTEVGVGDSTATSLSITITNPSPTAKLSGLAFTDTLPAGLTIDNPNGGNGTCGSSGVITANPGTSTFALTNGSLAAAASCTISISVVAAEPGVLSNSPGAVSSSAGSSAPGAVETLTVLPPPTVTVTNIKNKATYSFGQVVRPKFTCTQAGDPTVLSSCSAADDLGDTIVSGGKLNTTTPGAHVLSVVAASTDGLSTTDNISYKVLPDSRFTISNVVPKQHGALGFALALPGPGTVKVVELGPKHAVVGTDTVKVTQKRKLKVDLKPTKAGVKLLKPATGSAPVKLGVKLEVSFTPKGGVKRTVTHGGIELKSK
jgi:uncharacterized repeat protein (TIGR01451 family)